MSLYLSDAIYVINISIHFERKTIGGVFRSGFEMVRKHTVHNNSNSANQPKQSPGKLIRTRRRADSANGWC